MANKIAPGELMNNSKHLPRPVLTEVLKLIGAAGVVETAETALTQAQKMAAAL